MFTATANFDSTLSKDFFHGLVVRQHREFLRRMQRFLCVVRHSMPIYDARPLADSLSLDVEGFVLKRCSSAVSDFYDPVQVRSVYYPEVEQLVKEVTGVAKMVAFEHDVRYASKARLGMSAVREPVKVVHDDYSEKSAPGRVQLYLPKEADVLLQSRYEVINVWSAIGIQVAESPLAVCDARSIREEDVVPTEQGVKHEVYQFNFSPRHQWFYFPAMEPDEALLFKCFDSLNDGRACLTAHSAFDDPATPPNTRPRESIEVRTLAFFAPEISHVAPYYLRLAEYCDDRSAK